MSGCDRLSKVMTTHPTAFSYCFLHICSHVRRHKEIKHHHISRPQFQKSNRMRSVQCGAMLLTSFILLFLLHLLTCTGQDRIPTGASISGNQTIISAGENYALGFFNSPPNSSRWYVGVWFYQIPNRTFVWVANRENPLPDSAGKFTVTGNGNLEIVTADGVTIWSTNVTLAGSNRTAILSDSGNLALNDANNTVVWQSFDHPAATILPGMQFYLNVKTNASRRVVSWKDDTDPAPGLFSAGIDPRTPRQLQVLRGSTTYWRENTWFKELSASMPEPERNYVVYLSTVANDDEVYYTFTVSTSSVLVRYFLTPIGHIELQTWRDDTLRWKVLWSSQMNRCDIYGRCGPFASCDYNSTQSVCSCLDGFVPRVQREWDSGNWSRGCVRRRDLQCGGAGGAGGGGEDGFLQLERTKMPDFSISVGNISVDDCNLECRRNCSCAAYAYTNVSGWRASNCLIWTRNLTDVVSNYGKTVIFLRLASSELGTNITSPANSSSNDKKILLVILIPTIIGGTLCFSACGYLLRRRNKKKGMRRNGDETELTTVEGISELPFFTFRSVVSATSNFSPANKLGEGGFGPVYKGQLPEGQEVAVKRLSKSSGQGVEEFRNEVKLIARLQHRNLVRLLGWCVYQEEKILIYEYMANKSLDKFLFEPMPGSALDWGTRVRIIEGISQGLLYLHRHSRLRIIHRDLKTSNILLDGEMIPKISDFGLARIVEGNQSKVNTKRVAGTYGYMAPEYALDGYFSEKSDVYSFGVLLLEIVSGKRNTGFYPYKQSINLLGYAWQLWEEGRGMALVDPKVGDSCISHQVIKCIQLGLLCVQEDPNDRPTMSSVVYMFGSETSTAPKPKKPAFSTKKNPILADSSSDSPPSVSVNWVTISELEPK